MSDDHIKGYLQWITPKVGDPTYSLLKAHLLFEALLRHYLNRVLPHPKALEGSRLTFTQLLAVAKASSPHIQPDHWIWKAISELNKLRNTLSHETQPKALAERIEQYKHLIFENAGKPPPPSIHRSTAKPSDEHSPTQTGLTPSDHDGHLYTAIDLATIGLYYATAAALGYKLDPMP